MLKLQVCIVKLFNIINNDLLPIYLFIFINFFWQIEKGSPTMICDN